MKTCKLYIVRHGESVHNRDQISSGHTNPALTPKGKEQAADTKAKLASIHFDEVYSSDLERAVKTAEIIFGSPVPATHQLPGLRERDFGVFDGQPIEVLKEARATTQTTYEALADDQKWRYKQHHSMESDFELAERFMEALANIAEQNHGKTVLVAAHGGTLRTTLVSLGYLSQRELPSGSIQNAAYIELDYKDGEFEVGEVFGVSRAI